MNGVGGGRRNRMRRGLISACEKNKMIEDGKR
jgi:hypothetical protein